jgi:hypothetical protein
MNDKPPVSAFKDAAEQGTNLAIAPDILEWFKKRRVGWKQEIEGVLDFYIDSVEHPASDFEPGEMAEPDPPPALNSGPAWAMSRLMLKSAKRASLIENLRSLRGLGKMRVR